MHDLWIISLKSSDNNIIIKSTKQARKGKKSEEPNFEVPPLQSPNAGKSRPLPKTKVSTGVQLTASNDSTAQKLSKARKRTLRSAAVKPSSFTKEILNSSPQSELDSCHDQHTTDSSHDSDSAQNDWHNAQNKDHSPYLSLSRLQDLNSPTNSVHEEIVPHLSEADTRQDKHTSEASLASDSARNEWHVVRNKQRTPPQSTGYQCDSEGSPMDICPNPFASLAIETDSNDDEDASLHSSLFSSHCTPISKAFPASGNAQNDGLLESNKLLPMDISPNASASQEVDINTDRQRSRERVQQQDRVDMDISPPRNRAESLASLSSLSDSNLSSAIVVANDQQRDLTASYKDALLDGRTDIPPEWLLRRCSTPAAGRTKRKRGNKTSSAKTPRMSPPAKKLKRLKRNKSTVASPPRELDNQASSPIPSTNSTELLEDTSDDQPDNNRTRKFKRLKRNRSTAAPTPRILVNRSSVPNSPTHWMESLDDDIDYQPPLDDISVDQPDNHDVCNAANNPDPPDDNSEVYQINTASDRARRSSTPAPLHQHANVGTPAAPDPNPSSSDSDSTFKTVSSSSDGDSISLDPVQPDEADELEEDYRPDLNLISDEDKVNALLDDIAFLGKPIFKLHHAHVEHFTLITYRLLTIASDTNYDEKARLLCFLAFQTLPGTFKSMSDLKERMTPKAWLNTIIEANSNSGSGIDMANMCLKETKRIARKVEEKQAIRQRNTLNNNRIANGRRARDNPTLANATVNIAPVADIANRPVVPQKAPTSTVIDQHFKDSRLSKAMQSIDAYGTQQTGVYQGTTDEMKEKIAALHPDRTNARDDLPSLDEYDDDELRITHNLGQVLKIIDSMKDDSAQGVTGWSFQLIKQVCAAGASHSKIANLEHGRGNNFDTTANLFMTPVLKYFDAYTNNELPQSIKDAHNESRALLLNQKPPKLRPLGIGDCWARIIKVCTLKHDDVKGLTDRFENIQFCVGISCGTEICAAIAQYIYDKGWSQFIIDYRNAFNTPGRHFIDKSLRDTSPESRKLLRIFHCAYGSSSHLRATTRDGRNQLVGLSATGCTQGCPLAMALFACAIQPTLLTCNRIIKDALSEQGINVPFPCATAFADDAKLAAPHDLLPELLPALLDTCEKACPGLSIGYAKCGLLGKQVTTDDLLPLRESLSAANATALSICPVTQDGLNILGVPVGTDTFIEETTSSILADKSLSVRHLRGSGIGPVYQHSLAKHCINARCWYLARNVKPALARQAAITFDEAIDSSLSNILGTELSPSERIWRGLDHCYGGSGIPRMSGPAGLRSYERRTAQLAEFFHSESDVFPDLAQSFSNWSAPNALDSTACLGVISEDEATAFAEDPVAAVRNIRADPVLSAVVDCSSLPGFTRDNEADAASITLAEKYHLAACMQHAGALRHKILAVTRVREPTDPEGGSPYCIPGRVVEKENEPKLAGVIETLSFLLSGFYTKSHTSHSTSGCALNWMGGLDPRKRFNSSSHFRAFAKARVGATNRADADKECADHHETYLMHPYHGLNCRPPGDNPIAKRQSTSVEDAVLSFLKRALSGKPRYTVRSGNDVPFQIRDSESVKHADIVITDNLDATQPVHSLIDISIRSPVSHKTLDQVGKVRPRAETRRLTHGWAATYGESQKEKDYEKVADRQHKILPLVIESNGTVGTLSSNTLDILSDLTEDTTGIKTLMRTISFIISRYVGEALAKAAYDATSIVRDQQQPAQRNDLAQPRAAAQALAAPNLM